MYVCVLGGHGITRGFAHPQKEAPRPDGCLLLGNWRTDFESSENAHSWASANVLVVITTPLELGTELP